MSLYYFHNLPRLCYWWPNPNEASVMIGLFLPFIWTLTWYVERTRLAAGISYLILVTECAALLLVVNTYSRWAIASAICAILVFGLVAERPEKSRWREMTKGLKNTWIRILVLIIASITTGALGRFSTAVQGDKSVTNRLTLWTGGLKLIASEPVFGWGDGTAGLNYDNWFQNLSSQSMHSTMVNSYLNIAVEWGLPVLGIILFFLLSSMFLSYRLSSLVSSSKRGLLAGAAALITFFALANICYSTIYGIQSLLLLAVGILIVVIFCIRQWKALAFLKSIFFALVVSIVSVFALYFASSFALKNEPIRVTSVNEGNVLLLKPGQLGKTINLTIVPDYLVLGASYGRQIRNVLESKANHFDVIQVLEPKTNAKGCAGEKVIVLGGRLGDWETYTPKDGQEVVFVCPTAPPTGHAKLQRLFLPQIDRWHVVEVWKTWARENNCPITFLSGEGILDEVSFQKIMDECMKSKNA